MTNETILQIFYGGLLGIAGQGLRVMVGIKKVSDTSKAKNIQLKNLLDPQRIFISLLIGFLAGAIALIILAGFNPVFLFAANTRQNIFAIIAAGYAGTDFIEGLMKNSYPKKVQ